MSGPGVLDVLWERGILKGLDAAGRELIERSVRIESYKGGDMVYRIASRDADEQDSVVFVLDGIVRGGVESERRQVTLRYAAPGDAIGMFAMFQPIGKPKFAQAVTNAKVARLSRADLLALLDDRLEVSLAALDHLFEIQDVAVSHLVPNIFLPVNARIAAHLVELGELLGAGRPLGISHQMIADSVGTAREVVSRAVGRFVDENVLMRSPEGLVVLDVERLKALAAG